MNRPTFSFKDRVVATSLAWARQHGMRTVGCASTGNLANAVGAQASRHGFEAYVFIPDDLEYNKIVGTAVYGVNLIRVQGNYDKVNRLAYEVSDEYGWGMVNVNLRSYYGEGSKTLGYEILEQNGWRIPDHVVVPMAGGSLITKVHKAFQEFIKIGLVPPKSYCLHGAQAAGCAPIVQAWEAGVSHVAAVEPRTIVRSLAIGNPADGRYALETIRATGGRAVAVPDDEVIAAIKQLAETEGVFTETAGGVTVAAGLQLIRKGIIRSGEDLVLVITGNGLKTSEVLSDRTAMSRDLGPIRPTLKAFRKILEPAA